MKADIKKWGKAAGVRAVKTAAQTAVATIGVSAAMSEVDWLMVGSASLLAGILSLLTSVAGIPEVDGGESLAAMEEDIGVGDTVYTKGAGVRRTVPQVGDNAQRDIAGDMEPKPWARFDNDRWAYTDILTKKAPDDDGR